MTVKTRSYQIGIDADKNKNFVLKTPPIPDGSIALYRGNVDDLGDKVWEVDAQGNFKAKTIHLGTPVTLTNQTFVNFSIPEGAKRLTLILTGVSTSGASPIICRVGNSGGVLTSGYFSRIVYAVASNVSTNVSSNAGIVIASTNVGVISQAKVILDLGSDGRWYSNMGVAQFTSEASGSGVGSTDVVPSLTTLRLTTINGTDQMTAGTANISWEY